VEIGNGAKRLNDLPFRKSTCFMFGQEGSGTSRKHTDTQHVHAMLEVRCMKL